MSMSISGPKQFEHKVPYFNKKIKGIFLMPTVTPFSKENTPGQHKRQKI